MGSLSLVRLLVSVKVYGLCRAKSPQSTIMTRRITKKKKKKGYSGWIHSAAFEAAWNFGIMTSGKHQDSAAGKKTKSGSWLQIYPRVVKSIPLKSSLFIQSTMCLRWLCNLHPAVDGPSIRIRERSVSQTAIRVSDGWKCFKIKISQPNFYNKKINLKLFLSIYISQLKRTL